MTYFISHILNRPVLGSEGGLVGKVHDFIVEQRGVALTVVALVIRRPGRKHVVVPIEDVVERDEPFRLGKPAGAYPVSALADDLLYLSRDILDAQVIDTNGAKVIRVNDVQLDWLPSGLLVSGVDIGLWGLTRRLGLASALSWVARTFKLKVPEGLVPWQYIAPVGGLQGLRLQVAHNNLKGMHPADLAEIISDLGHAERLQFLEDISLEQMADVVEESEPALQVAILRDLGEDKAADLLDEMEPDEAADLLDALPEHESERLMELMEPEGAEVVRELMAYAEDTAGALMTPRYLSLPGTATVAEALGRLRGALAEREEVIYLYVEADEVLTGIVSLRRLLAASDETQLADIAVPVAYKLPPDASQREVLDLMARYNILAVPIVDESEHMEGIVTIYDVFDKLVELSSR